MTEVIDSNSLLALNNAPRIVGKRINAELKTLIKKYTNLYIRFDNDLELIKLHIHDNNITPNYNTFTFIIPPEYPFKPPIVKLDSDDYINLLKIYKKEESEFLKQITGKSCLCCNTCVNKDNWGPAITIDSILDEIKQNLIIVKTVKNRLLNNDNNNQFINDDEKNLTKQV